MIIAFHNFKGGVGSTTLSAHMCALAQELGIKVVGVSIDFKQELRRWLAALKIPCIELDLEHGNSDAELIVLDVQSHTKAPLIPDVLILPICSRMAAESAADVSDRLQGRLIWLGNKGYKPTVPAYLADEAELALPMPYSRALCQAAAQKSIIWNIAELAHSSGAMALRATLRDVLVRAFVAAGEPIPPALKPRDLATLMASDEHQAAE